MNIHDFPADNQRTKNWRLDRLGMFTGSEIYNLLKSPRTKSAVWAETTKDYIYNKMSERDIAPLTLANEDIWEQYLTLTSPTSRAMQFGIDNEGDARRAYWRKFQASGLDLIVTGSVKHTTIQTFASSPDGVIYDVDSEEAVGTLEIKVPSPAVYMRYRNEICDGETLKALRPEYYYQCQSHMMVTDTQWCDFVAYNPFVIHQLHVARIERDEAAVALIAERIHLAEAFIETSKEAVK